MGCFRFGEIVLPKEPDVRNWAVVACDQYSSNPAYWRSLEESLTPPTTLNLIFPEAYLNAPGKEKRIRSIIETQARYAADGLFRAVDGTVVLKRETAYGHTHHGLMLLVDLDDYSVVRGEKTLIRATEAVVPERVPPRVAVRKDCLLELPHIMALYDDPADSVLGPYRAASAPVLYEGELNGNGGRITGYQVTDTRGLSAALDALVLRAKRVYGEELLFLVGDGNHSLATAKACRTDANPKSKYALVEAVNIYDPGILFEPIHRVIHGIDAADFLAAYAARIKGGARTAGYVGGDAVRLFVPENAIDAVKAVDAFLEAYQAEKGGEIDYIHGEAELKAVASRTGGVGIVLRKMQKEALFPYIVQHGPLPKKTFSMGEADEKRYYIEARYIRSC